MKEYVLILTTIDTKEAAEKIADGLLRNRYAACVQIVGPITSMYWWKDRIEKAIEWLCIAKTRRDMYKVVESAIRQNHKYETPEILAAPVLEGSESYLSWLDETLRK